ncbi:PLP-dependent aminotransferase family protein [Chitinophaga agrisoli]|uniref:PLP-dependent aminotransferase family protein n=1 Tax=Chitinophaga agrisoli TaxID=2607653 RepID=A0A5B2VU94_9BACT|nr:PLP-dependent aminotransferase family protein [Chitinophaga agrisoli]KAA2243373.1 PLP-dependent aminotransferase family protein [Chitinophaga agrisoli]
MPPFYHLIVTDRHLKVPIARQISNQIVNLIRDGVIVPGAALPATRSLADLIKTNRKTVVRAYDDLLSQDWIEALPRRGYRVKQDLPVLKPRSFQPPNKFAAVTEIPPAVAANEDIYALIRTTVPEHEIIVNDGMPDHRLTPVHDMLRELRRQADNISLARSMYYLDDGGAPTLKAATASFINSSRGLNVNDRNVVITRGAQMAIFLAVSLFVKPGDHVVVTDPNYIFADESFLHAGAIINRVSVDAEGMVVEELEDILQQRKIKMLYIAPHHHHPTTVTMSAERRLKLLQLINKYDFYVIEDDYDYDFHHENRPILPLAASGHGGKIIYVGSYGKLVGPTVRMGFLIASPEVVNQVNRLKRLIDLKGDTLMEYVIADMIVSGALDRHIKNTNKIYAQRRKLFSHLLTEYLDDELHFEPPQGGLALWVKLAARHDLKQVMRRAGNNGLHLLGSFCLDPDNPHGNSIRLGFASLSDEEIAQVVEVLRTVLK